jgi:4-hydroxythreonine-4-phosphate dehydrogenase
MRAMSKPLPPLALTMGEPAGIAPEITLKAWVARHEHRMAPFFLIGDPALLERSALRNGLTVKLKEITKPSEASTVFVDALPVFSLTLPETETPGKLNAANAKAVLSSIDLACDFAMVGEASGIVTNPIHKRVLYEAGLSLPGHTEYLAERSGGATPVMMLSCSGLRVVPVTVHRALRDAVGDLTRELIVEKGMILARALQKDFGISTPRIAVAALNPHASEEGHFGHEEAEIIAPAIAELARQGINAAGPWSADTLFHAGARAQYDAALCMYHDQALIPVKTLGFEEGVNTTLGLPIVRTSPDHGTALDIAGKGVAHPGALIAAIKLAHEIAHHRANA